MRDRNEKHHNIQTSTGTEIYFKPQELVTSLGWPMKFRLRFMFFMLFIFILPAFYLGVARLSAAEEESHIAQESQKLANALRSIYFNVENVQSSLWQLEAEASEDLLVDVFSQFDKLSHAFLIGQKTWIKVQQNPHLKQELLKWYTSNKENNISKVRPMTRIQQAIGRARNAFDDVLNTRNTKKNKWKPNIDALRRAHQALNSVLIDAQSLSTLSTNFSTTRNKQAQIILTYTTRNQLIIFILVLLLFPFLIIAAPSWILGPLERLKTVINIIKFGRARELVATGEDEISHLVRALQTSLLKLNSRDQKKTHKIYEMRKLIRATITLSKEAILIIGKRSVIDYANQASAQMLGTEMHKLEKQSLDQIIFVPELLDTIAKVRDGNIEMQGIDIAFETEDGRVVQRHAEVAGIIDQKGRIVRVVLIFHTKTEESL